MSAPGGARVAVIGSRKGASELAVRDYVSRLPSDTVIVSGGAGGADRWAQEAAEEFGLIFDPVLANWERFGKAAGKIRNWPLVGGATRVAAFWDGWSNGTSHGIAASVAQGIPVEVWLPAGFEHARAHEMGAPCSCSAETGNRP